MDSFCSAIFDRASWQARPPGPNVTTIAMPVQNAVFLQTASPACDTFARCAYQMQSIQNDHMNNNGWTDIGYNFLIGGDGSVFEGRGWGVRGSYFVDMNAIAHGTAFIGNFADGSNRTPTDAAILAAQYLLRCAVEKGMLVSNYTLRRQYLNQVTLDLIGPNANSNITTTPADTTERPEDSDMLLKVVVPAVVLACFSLALIAILMTFRRRLASMHDREKSIRKEIPSAVVEKYEIPRWAITMTNTKLGVGCFGVVWKAHMLEQPQTPGSQPRTVAAKLIRSPLLDEKATEGFLKEMTMLMKTGRHVNIVNLLGVVLEGQLMIIMEHCALGSLHSYLQQQRSVCDKADNSADTVELTSFAYQIARGMEFVSSRNIIHRDLSARNILVDEHKQAKIADFGMARETEQYVLQRENVKLPMRWMAPESLAPRRGTYSTQSDVWSYGVVLWELFSYGDVPYNPEFPKGLTHDELRAFLERGQRPVKPELCSDAIYEIMTDCWSLCPTDRCTFHELTGRLEEMLPTTLHEMYVLFDAENNVFNMKLDETYSHL